MDDTALKKRLDGILLLLVMIVSLLSGLVFGHNYHADQVDVAIISFVVLGVVFHILDRVRSSDIE